MIKGKPLAFVKTSSKYHQSITSKAQPGAKRMSLASSRPNTNACTLLEQASSTAGSAKRRGRLANLVSPQSVRTAAESSGWQKGASARGLDRTAASVRASPGIGQCGKSVDLLGLIQEKSKQIEEMEVKMSSLGTKERRNSAQLERVRDIISKLRRENDVFKSLLDTADKIIVESPPTTRAKDEPLVCAKGMLKVRNRLQALTVKRAQKQETGRKEKDPGKRLNLTQCARYAPGTVVVIGPRKSVVPVGDGRPKGVAERMDVLKGRLKKVLTNGAKRITGLQTRLRPRSSAIPPP